MAEHKRQIVYGLHAVRHCLLESPTAVLEIWIQRDKKQQRAIDELKAIARTEAISVQLVSAASLEDKAHTSQHQGVVLSRQAYAVGCDVDLQDYINSHQDKRFLFLILDNVQDPHNLGACFRTADAVGADGIIVSKNRSASLTSTVCKVACGAVESVPFYSVTNLARTIRTLKDKNVWIYGLDGSSRQALFHTDLTVSTAIVMGSEGEGLRANTRQHCDQLLHIPMHGVIESLNVSAATAVCLYEVLRQRSAN